MYNCNTGSSKIWTTLENWAKVFATLNSKWKKASFCYTCSLAKPSNCSSSSTFPLCFSWQNREFALWAWCWQKWLRPSLLIKTLLVPSRPFDSFCLLRQQPGTWSCSTAMLPGTKYYKQRPAYNSPTDRVVSISRLSLQKIDEFVIGRNSSFASEDIYRI